jgi:hypothetical protein
MSASSEPHFPYEEITLDQYFRFTLVVLPHIYRFLKACTGPAPAFAAIAIQEVSLFGTLRRMLARKFRNEDYAVIIEHIWSHMSTFSAHPEESFKAIGEISAALYHYLSLNFKRARSFFALAVEMLPSEQKVKNIFERIESQYSNQFRLIVQAVNVPQLATVKPAENVDELEFLRYSPAGRRLWTLGVTAPEAFAVCLACRAAPAVNFAFPCCCGIVCAKCQVPADLKSCPVCSKPVTEIGNTQAVKLEIQ